MRNGKRRIVGDLLNFRGMAYAPTNEAGVVALFSMVARDLNMYIEDIGSEFPDCTARRFNGRGWEQVAVEFEYDSNSFREHGHDPTQCDVIVCWADNWIDRPADIEVISLAAEIKKLPNTPILRPERMPF